MRLVYIDEAGISNPAQEPWVVVAGVIVHGDHQLVAVRRHLNRIVKRYVPERFRKGFVFHATELFNGGGNVFRRLRPGEYGPEEFPLKRRLAIANEIAAIPKRFSLPVTYGYVERAKWATRFSATAEYLTEKRHTVGEHATAYMFCILEVEHWFRDKAPQEHCVLIVEDNQQARELIRDTQVANMDATFVGSIEGDAAKRHLPLRKIAEDPLFQQKRSGSVMQLADFLAYVGKKMLMGDDRYRPLFDLFQGQIYLWPRERARTASTRSHD